MTPRQLLMSTLLPAVLLSSSGCTVAQYTSVAISWYCATPQPARQANRILVNAYVAPNAVAIYCEGESRD